MEILDYGGIKSLGITKEACEAYLCPQVRTRYGIKVGAVYSPSCTKLLSTDGSYTWEGDYEADYGLFGQKVCTKGEPIHLVASDLEALRMMSLGVKAVCLAEPRHLDPITFSVLSDNLRLLTDTVIVWQGSSFGKRRQAMEKFLLYLAGTGNFTLESVEGSDEVPLLTAPEAQITTLLQNASLTDWKPKGIAFTNELLRDRDFLKPKLGVKTGFKCIDESNGGIRRAEITMFAAGSGVGKTTGIVEIAYHFAVVENQKCGIILLEEQAKEALMRFAAIYFNIPLSELMKNPDLATKEQWREFKHNQRIRDNLVFHNHFGSLDSDTLFDKMSYMVDFCGCAFIFLDHITMAVSGMTSKEGERKDIDILMTRLATMAVSKNVGVVAITHLSVPEGKPHEEGGRVTLSQLRGSGSIKQLSFSIFAQERNQQDPDSTLTLLRQLKGRYNNGQTGPIGVLNYDKKSGRMKEDFTWTPQEFEKTLGGKYSKQEQGGIGGKSSYGPHSASQPSPMRFVEPF